jgi:hypothetical protein
MTTYRAWVDYLETLTPAGVVKLCTSGPPAALNTADLPEKWVQNVHSENRPSASGSEGGDRTLYATIVVVLGPVAQDGIDKNYDAALDMCDALETMMAGTFATSPLIGPQTWSTQLANIGIGNIMYWAATSSIEGLG